jgi:hypothetical protein
LCTHPWIPEIPSNHKVTLELHEAASHNGSTTVLRELRAIEARLHEAPVAHLESVCTRSGEHSCVTHFAKHCLSPYHLHFYILLTISAVCLHFPRCQTPRRGCACVSMGFVDFSKRQAQLFSLESSSNVQLAYSAIFANDITAAQQASLTTGDKFTTNGSPDARL